MNSRKWIVTCFVLVLLCPALAHAQDEDYGEEFYHPLNPEYSVSDYQIDYFNYQINLQEIQAAIEAQAAYMQGAMATALMSGWSFDEIYYSMAFSMFSQGGGMDAFYGCMLGYSTVIGGVSMLMGPAAPGFFFGGFTVSSVYCAMRHF